MEPGLHFHADQLGQEFREYEAAPVHEALAYSVKRRRVTGNVAVNIVELTIGVAGDYPAGGIALDARSCGLDSIDEVDVLGTDKPVLVQYDPVGLKVKAWKGNGVAVFVEAAGADVAGGILRMRVAGGAASGY